MNCAVFILTTCQSNDHRDEQSSRNTLCSNHVDFGFFFNYIFSIQMCRLRALCNTFKMVMRNLCAHRSVGNKLLWVAAEILVLSKKSLLLIFVIAKCFTISEDLERIIIMKVRGIYRNLPPKYRCIYLGLRLYDMKLQNS